MRCTNRNVITAFALALTVFMLTGCSSYKFDMPYDADSKVSSMNVLPGQNAQVSKTFASDLCVVISDKTDDEAVDMSQAASAVLFDVNNKEVLYSKNAHERMYPASLTKVMTALVALKNGSLDQVLTATDAVRVTESGAQLCGLKSGDTMTLDQALHVLLMYSANDAALLIAENIGGSVEHFIEMMNEEAKRLGATNTNFVNPHGLSDNSHYTTAYDLYLIFNEAIKYSSFNEIIHLANYQTTYYDKNGSAQNLTFESTNRFVKGTWPSPDNITVIGGKTGTTAAAGHCLMILARDVNGAPYIAVILRSESTDLVYTEMVDLLDEINK